MNRLQVFDPPLCCVTGVCGADVDPRLSQFAADLEWLAGRGISVARYNLAQEPAAFVSNVTVRDLMGQWGSLCLPVLLHNDKVLTWGRYPSRAQLAAMVGPSEAAP